MLDDIVSEYSQDIAAIDKFCDDLYDRLFAKHFREVRNLYQRMQSKLKPISDSELEYILIMLPVEMFSVAESLNKIRLQQEVVKLKNREKVETLRKELTAQATDLGMNKSQMSEYVSHGLSEAMVEYEVLSSAYESVITRVSNEQTFSKELIMGAKKVWDSRRSSEASNPVAPIKGDLPDYDPTSSKSYIK